MNNLFLDFETVSLANLKKTGLVNYAEHESTHIRTVGWRYKGKTTTIIHPLLTKKSVWGDLKQFLSDIRECDRVIAHNSAFDRLIFENCMNRFIKDSKLNKIVSFRRLEWEDSAAWCRAVGVPDSLSQASLSLGCKETKGDGGLMKRTCTLQEEMGSDKPTVSGFKAHWVELPGGGWHKCSQDVEELVAEYCRQDVDTLVDLWKKLNKRAKFILGDFLPYAKDCIKMTEDMNKHGFEVDIERLEKIKEMADSVRQEANRFCEETFGVNSIFKREQIKKAIQDNGYNIKNTQRATMEGLALKHPNDKWIRRYLELNTTSLNKADAGLRLVNGKRIYHSFKACGAGITSRWTASGIQPQNLPRPTKKLEEIEEFFSTWKGGYSDELEKYAVSAIRSCIVAPKGKVLFTVDLKQIEPRFIMWRLGLDKLLEDVHGGRDIYKDAASMIYNVAPEEIGKDSRERYVGKQSELSKHYGIGDNKLMMQVLAQSGVLLSKTEVDGIDMVHRKRYPEVRAVWLKYDKLLQKNLGKEWYPKLVTGRRLPFGKLYKGYWVEKEANLALKTALKKGEKYKRRTVAYKIGKTTNSLWGATILNNSVQSTCRDLMLFKMLGMWKKGYKIVGTVHDECWIELDENVDRASVEKDWNGAGMEEINKFFPGLLLDYDIEWRRRYFK